MKKISIHEAEEVFQQHAKEIMKAARRSSSHGFKVLAEVENDGTWRGAGIVTPGTGSLLAYEGRGYAAYFSCSPFRSLAEIQEQISEWYFQKSEQESA